MGKKKKMSRSEQDGIQYRRAKMWQIAISQLCTAAPMCFYILMTYATYIGNSNYGILVGVTGLIMTVSRLFDGVTDPICAFLIERVNTKYGKIRIFMLSGWAVMSLATTAMCNWGAGRLNGVAGLVFFIVCYLLYIVGYTLTGVSTNLLGPIITNDPEQRPIIGVWSTVYGYLTPMVMSTVGMVILLPKYDNQISTPFLGALNLFCVVVSLVLFLISCVGVAAFDKPENFQGISSGDQKDQKPSVRDMFNLIRENKELQRYIVAGSSDKLAQTIGGASVVTTMLYGIMIGNMSISTILSTVAMIPSILFAIIGARIAGKRGNMKTVVEWTWICIIWNVIFAAFLLFSDTTSITVAMIPTALFFLLTLGCNATKMVVSSATVALRMDVIDHELYRSGKYLPATISATYTLIDKIISAFGASIATLLIGFIGYTTTAPQQGDPLTMGVRVMTVLLYCGFPILGWICTILAMKKSTLTKEHMVEIQKDIEAKKKAA
nr:MFS transporter [uncultured Marvinbryantia sp.]